MELIQNIRKKINFYQKYLGLYLQSRLYSIWNHEPLRKKVATPVSQYPPSAPHMSHPVSQALSSSFAYQFNEAACSVASVATVLNAAHLILDQQKGEGRITQQEVLKRVDVVNWSARISPEGFQNRRGLPIDSLGMVVKKAFEVYEIPCTSLVTIPLTGSSRPDVLKKELFQKLVHFQYHRNCFLIAHFNQGVLLKGLHLPHISPIMSVDMENRMVCILDVDPQVSEPYWVSFDNFWKGISWRYDGILRRHGYESGGYVWIQLDKPSLHP
jgi:hypothetical protein